MVYIVLNSSGVALLGLTFYESVNILSMLGHSMLGMLLVKLNLEL